jgi:hypothetical protein
MEHALEKARSTSARELGVDADVLTFTTYADPDVAGLLVFHAEQSDDRGRIRHMGGAVVNGRVYADGPEALGKVFEAWGYGPTRTKSAEDVARVAVMLVRSQEPSQVMTTTLDMSVATRMGFADAAPPAEVDVDGTPGVRFWFKNGYNPVTEVDVAPASTPGAAATIRMGRTHGGG